MTDEAVREPGDEGADHYLLIVVATLATIALVCILGLVRVPYASMSPGPAVDTLGDFGDQPLITIGKSAKTFPTDGELDFTSVAVTRPDTRYTFYDALGDYFTPDSVVVPRTLLYPENQSDDQVHKQLEAEMASAKDFSRYAALRAAGYTVRLETSVAAVTKGKPAYGHLRKGDVIVAVDGKKPTSVQGVVDAVSSRAPGTPVDLTVRRDARELTMTVDTFGDTASPAKGTKGPRTRIGVALRPAIRYPFTITNHIARIGGPSAGAMFALAIYDKLTPGSLTGGRHIAGTGTIDPAGRIGAIGGVRQKLAGASRAKATVFLVPAANCREALLDADDSGRVDGMRLVRVATLRRAVDSLTALARDPKASVPSCGRPD